MYPLLNTKLEAIQYTAVSLLKMIRLKLPEYDKLRSDFKLKDDNSIVTQADLEINSLAIEEIRSTLLINDREAKFNVISEEQEYDSTVDYNIGYTLIIDPIDGTENFFSGMKEWGVCISIYKDGKHWYSTILLPDLNILIDSEIKIQRFENSRIVGLSSSLTAEDLAKVMEDKTDDEEYRIIGCAAYNLYSYITGAYKKFINVKGVNTWDVSAGLNIMLANKLHPVVNDRLYMGELLLPTKKYKLHLS